jgi:hypothetical protein
MNTSIRRRTALIVSPNRGPRGSIPVGLLI